MCVFVYVCLHVHVCALGRGCTTQEGEMTSLRVTLELKRNIKPQGSGHMKVSPLPCLWVCVSVCVCSYERV